MGGEPAIPEARPGMRQRRRHEVPRHAPTRQRVERRYLAGEGAGRGLQHRTGAGEAEVFGGMGQSRDEQDRIIHRDLQAFDD